MKYQRSELALLLKTSPLEAGCVVNSTYLLSNGRWGL